MQVSRLRPFVQFLLAPAIVLACGEATAPSTPRMMAPSGSSQTVLIDPHTPQWNPANNHYYQVMESWSSDPRWFGMNFFAGGARYGKCTSGHLVTIKDADEGAFLANLTLDGRRYFVGAFRFHAAVGTITEGWGWVGGESFSYAPWLPGQPTGNTSTDYGSYLQGGTGSIAAIDANAGGLPSVIEYEGCPFNPPVASISGPTTVAEGTAVTLTASASDPDGDVLSYSWTVDGVDAGTSTSVTRTYPTSGTHSYVLTVDDSRGHVVSAAATLTVTDAAPVIAPLANAVLTEGSTYTAAGSFSDPGTNTWTATVDYGDGSGSQALTLAADKTFSLDHKYATAGIYTVSVTVSDGELSSTKTATVTYGNFPPTAVISPGGSVNMPEGATRTLSAASSSDPNGDALTFTWALDGDGTFETTGATAVVGPRADNGVKFTATLKATDPSGLSNTASVEITVTNVNPVVAWVGPTSIVAGATWANTSGSFTDAGANDAPWTATVDYGEGAGPQPLTLKPDKTFSLSHVFSKLGFHNVVVRVTDKDGGTGARTVRVNVLNGAPTVTTGGPYTVVEGSPLTLTATAVDPNGDDITYGWDLDGDGTFETSSLTASVNYPDNGVHTVSFRATDSRGSVSTASTTITVLNASPLLTSIAGATIIAGETYSAAGTFTDPGSDTWTATVNYGISSLPLTLSGKSFSLNHTYATAGTYTVSVTVTDDDGGSGTVTAMVVVQSAAQATTALSSTIDALVASGALDAGTANSMTQSLSAAASSLANGNTNAAKNQLDAFANKVSAQSGKKLTVEQANALLSMVARIKANIG
jgi:PKD repeat protein